MTPEAFENIYKAVAEKADKALDNGTHQLVAVDVADSGHFPYYYKDTNNYFTQATWTWINQLAVQKSESLVGLGEPLATRYDTLINELGYGLSSGDRDKLNRAKIDGQQQTQQVVAAYESIYGEISQRMITDAKQATKIDYIMVYQVSVWAGGKQVHLTGGDIRNLRRELPNLPPSAEPLLNPMAGFLNAIASALGLQNSLINAMSLLTNVQNNTELPSETNGGLFTAPDKKYHVGYDINVSPSELYTAIADGRGASFSIELACSDYDHHEAELKIDGKAGGKVPVGDLFTVGLSTSVHYNMRDLNTEQSNFSLKMTFQGVVGVPIQPRAYQQDQSTGWWYPRMLAEAVGNKDKDVSGWQFKPLPEDLALARIPFLGISQAPTVEINFTSGKETEHAESLEESASLDVSFLGIPVVSGTQHYESSKITRHGENAGYSITLSPQAPSGNLTDQRAFVVGAEIERPLALRPTSEA